MWWEDVLASAVPRSTDAVTARLLAHATTSEFADGVNAADRGPGLVRTP